jgi:hypothetical protein
MGASKSSLADKMLERKKERRLNNWADHKDDIKAYHKKREKARKYIL